MSRTDRNILTPRQLELARWITQGLKNKEIAEKMGISLFVVKNYIRHIYDKRGFDNRVELALWFLHEFPEELNLLSK